MANTPWRQITERYRAAFDGAEAEATSLAAYAGVKIEFPAPREATEYETIAARVERLAANLAKINEALAAPEDTDDESAEANALAVDAAAPIGPTTRRKAGRPAAQPQTDQPEPGEN